MLRPQSVPAPAASFEATLAERIASAGRKGDRTRARIRWAAAAALMQDRYATVSIEDICSRADVSRTAFYIYFPSKADLVRDVLIEFQRSVTTISRGPRGGPLEAIRSANQAFAQFVRLNAPLMERIRELRDELPELIGERQRVNQAWAARITAAARRGGNTLPEAALLVRAHALIFMSEDLLREVHVIRNPNVAGLAEDEAMLIEQLSQVWYHSLYSDAHTTAPAGSGSGP